MNGVNYLLLLKGDSNQAGAEASVRGFNKLEAAQAAMVAAYKKMAALYNIPIGSNISVSPHTIRTKNSIRFEWNGDYFKWEIIEAVPEDDISHVSDRNKRRPVRQFSVTIEEHIAQEFPVEAWDIFHAIDIAEQSYKRGKFIVHPSTPNTRLIMARDEETGDTSEWKSF